MRGVAMLFVCKDYVVTRLCCVAVLFFLFIGLWVKVRWEVIIYIYINYKV